MVHKYPGHRGVSGEMVGVSTTCPLDVEPRAVGNVTPSAVRPAKLYILIRTISCLQKRGMVG